MISVTVPSLTPMRTGRAPIVPSSSWYHRSVGFAPPAKPAPLPWTPPRLARTPAPQRPVRRRPRRAPGPPSAAIFARRAWRAATMVSVGWKRSAAFGTVRTSSAG